MLSSTTLLGLAALLPGVLASYTGLTCGDTRAGTCPGKPFVGSTFTGLLCGLGDNTPQEAFADLTFQGPTALTECAQICATSSLFVLYQEFAGPGLTGSCYCASDIDYAVLLAAAVDCSGADVVATYFHPDAAAASGLARRKETSDAAKRRQIETNTFCPPGLTPCRIPGASEGYECLNTMTELESCGGCVAGLYSIPEAILTTQLDQRADRSPWLGPLPPYVYGTAITKRSDEIAGFDCTSEALRRGEQLTCKLGLCVGL